MSALQFGEEMGELGESEKLAQYECYTYGLFLLVAGEVWREKGGMRGEVEMVGPQLEVLLED